MVANGKAVPGLASQNTNQWGKTLGGTFNVWRSGLGVTKDGAIVYVGGPSLSISDLANVLVRSDKLDDALKWAGTLGRWLEKAPKPGIRALGPAAAPLSRLKGDYRYHFVLKSASRARLNALLRAELGRVLDGTLALGEALARKERDYAPMLPAGVSKAMSRPMRSSLRLRSRSGTDSSPGL